jgi:uroporphyrinogen decarboxylase
VDLVHQKGKKFLLHSCGNIFDVMEDIVDTGIDAKHSNEDAIAPFEKWIENYSQQIGLFGGIDVDNLCQNNYDDVFKYVYEKGKLFRNTAKGFGIGSGNSITSYVPVHGFQGMIDAVKKIRNEEE